MRPITILAAAATLAFAAHARADDPPPPVKPADPPVKPAEPPAKPAEPAAKHENKITDEAKAVFEKLAKTANGPIQKGMKEASGTITAEMPQGALAMKFTVKAPGVVHVETPEGRGQGGEPGGGQRGGGGRGPRGPVASAENLLGYAFGLFRPADDVEFDAEAAKKDGKDVLTVTRFKDGEQTERREMTVDADGLLVSAVVTRSQPGRDGKKSDVKTEVSYTWSKHGDAYRLDKYETKAERGSTTVAIVYADAAGRSLPTSWKMTTQMGEVEFKVGDLVVDGKAVEAPKKDEGAAPKKDDEKPGDGGKKDEK
jgi:hypothetical protein